jgi:hypothetical protein
MAREVATKRKKNEIGDNLGSDSRLVGSGTMSSLTPLGMVIK